MAPELRLLLEPTDAEHEGADTDYLEYYRAELSPRLRAEDLAIDDRDVVDVGDGEHLVVLGTWRDTSFCHDLWFVAGLERTHAGTYRVVLFRKLRAPVAALRAIDLDRDGRAEVVLRTLFGEPGDGPAWHVHVVSRGWTGWTCSDLASSGQIRLLDEGSLFVDGSRAWTWSSQGFTTSSNNR